MLCYCMLYIRSNYVVKHSEPAYADCLLNTLICMLLFVIISPVYYLHVKYYGIENMGHPISQWLPCRSTIAIFIKRIIIQITCSYILRPFVSFSAAVLR